ncbi:MAG: ribonuclease H-like domain-containing protein [Bacteroidetes bacterium]|nr:ribonuclease H-like domain-containing protein [Bacteroidota bacterium]
MNSENHHNKVVVDIETVGIDFETLDSDQQKYLLKFAKSEEDAAQIKQQLNLYPLTAQIVAIGLLDPDTEKGIILFQSDKVENYFSEDNKITFSSDSEKNIVTTFWSIMQNCNKIITFNGRGFDAPFLMIRSAMLDIKTTVNLMPNRYSTDKHIDLLDQLTFYSATRKFSLDFYCKQFGIESPKSHGITGLDMNKMFNDKKFKEIAEYCLWDLKATAQLYHKWAQNISH